MEAVRQLMLRHVANAAPTGRRARPAAVVPTVPETARRGPVGVRPILRAKAAVNSDRQGRPREGARDGGRPPADAPARGERRSDGPSSDARRGGPDGARDGAPACPWA